MTSLATAALLFIVCPASAMVVNPYTCREVALPMPTVEYCQGVDSLYVVERWRDMEERRIGREIAIRSGLRCEPFLTAGQPRGAAQPERL